MIVDIIFCHNNEYTGLVGPISASQRVQKVQLPRVKCVKWSSSYKVFPNQLSQYEKKTAKLYSALPRQSIEQSFYCWNIGIVFLWCWYEDTMEYLFGSVNTNLEHVQKEHQTAPAHISITILTASPVLTLSEIFWIFISITSILNVSNVRLGKLCSTLELIIHCDEADANVKL